jgi:putative selenate reductase molybdopterin-binding subunit
MDGVAPAVGNAVLDACGADVCVLPITPERVWRAIRDRDQQSAISDQPVR